MSYGYNPWAAHDVVTADELNAIGDQGVPVFANEAARDVQWPAPPVGARSALENDPTGVWWYAGVTGWHRQGATNVGVIQTNSAFGDGSAYNAPAPGSFAGPWIAGHLYRIHGRCDFTGEPHPYSLTMRQTYGAGPTVTNYSIADVFPDMAGLAGRMTIAGTVYQMANADRYPVFRLVVSSNGANCHPSNAYLFVDDLGPMGAAALELELEGDR